MPDDPCAALLAAAEEAEVEYQRWKAEAHRLRPVYVDADRTILANPEDADTWYQAIDREVAAEFERLRRWSAFNECRQKVEAL